eukprot:CAMPEP_0195330900 /NCGR_PEP_ID=MMETSP0708-20121125/12327_1 /TAXON_ID=33640 /ORGANISM="Asterionellopsis glacialis, Strain CCMP134" /LENGTH=113 /DNA_ID=CAMNT_0040399295 /DNA_START=23 /DNA_END=365 /DNA_ORIENTATION=-
MMDNVVKYVVYLPSKKKNKKAKNYTSSMASYPPLVLTSMSDGTVRLWDARNGALVQTVTGHEDMINDLAVEFVTPEQQGGGTAVIVTGSDDKTVRLFEIDIATALEGGTTSSS